MKVFCPILQGMALCEHSLIHIDETSQQEYLSFEMIYQGQETHRLSNLTTSRLNPTLILPTILLVMALGVLTALLLLSVWYSLSA